MENELSLREAKRRVAEVARADRLLPDKAKMVAYLTQIMVVPAPLCADREAQKTMADIKKQVFSMAQKARRDIHGLSTRGGECS